MNTALIDLPDGSVTTPRGFLAGAAAAGIRDDSPPGHLDLALLVAERRCAAAATYTKNRFQAPPLRLTQRHLKDGAAQAVVVNTGSANSLTGEQGERDAQETADMVAQKLGFPVEDIVVSSTGVTGWPLPVDKIRTALEHIIPVEDGGDVFAHAILTTDTVAKQAAARFQWDGVSYTVGGAAKGSGMVNVNMATMLAFLTTDAPIDNAPLAALLRETVDASFNMLTIDSAVSTNDMALVLASGAAGGERIDDGHPALPLLGAALTHVATTLTRKLARDGEGATKLIDVRVDGAARLDDARSAAKAVVGSMLLKAALYGNDPNWGRVLDAVGYCGVDVPEEKLALWLQDTEVYRGGQPVPYDEAALRSALDHSEVSIRVDLGVGEATATAWGCDLSPEYVRINSEYTT